MEKDYISIVIVNYNSERYFDRCIQSILNQTYPKAEIIHDKKASRFKACF